MKKENGRIKPADDVEVGTQKGKPYYCTACGEKKFFKDVEFSATTKCEACGGNMEEVWFTVDQG